MHPENKDQSSFYADATQGECIPKWSDRSLCVTLCVFILCESLCYLHYTKIEL
jgi:hypothetical protein